MSCCGSWRADACVASADGSPCGDREPVGTRRLCVEGGGAVDLLSADVSGGLIDAAAGGLMPGEGCAEVQGHNRILMIVAVAVGARVAVGVGVAVVRFAGGVAITAG